MIKIYKYVLLGLVFMHSTSMFSQVLIIEDFDSSSSLPNGWSSPTLPDFIVTSNNACQINSVRGPLSTSSTNPELVFMSQNATGEAIEISFDYKILLDAANSAPADKEFGSLELQYSIDDGKNWTTYHTINSSNHVPSTLCTRISHIISGSDIPANSKFGWRIKGHHNKGSSYIFIDNFKAIEDVDCKQPFEIIIEEVSFESISISWTELNSPSATQWEIAYCPKDIKPSNPACFLNNTITVTSNPYIITGLDEATEYDIYIRSVCSSNSRSAWSAPIRVQTLALGTDCGIPIEITSLPYDHTSNTKIYGNNYNGTPGTGCYTTGDFLDGYDVVYKYSSAKEDILQIELSGDLAEFVGMFVYESCSDIGTNCYTGAFTTEGKDFSIKDLNVQAGKDYYIVISTIGKDTSTKYTLNITGFDCAFWEAPSGNSSYEFFNQTLADFSGTSIGVNPTTEGAELVWYSDANLSFQLSNLSNIQLSDGAEFWVVQEALTCVSPFLHVTFSEFNCNDLSITDVVATSMICEEGTTKLVATAATDNLLWYDQEIGGEIIGVGANIETPLLTETTTFWVSEYFGGEQELKHQANRGPFSAVSTKYPAGVEFELSESIILKDTQVYVTGPAGDITIELINAKREVMEQRIIYVDGGSLSKPNPAVIPLNFTIDNPTEGPFKLIKTSGPALLFTASAHVNFPYLLGNVGAVTGGVMQGQSNNDYYYFYNWTINSSIPLCESKRAKVDVVVNEKIDISINTASDKVCFGEQATLIAYSSDSDYEYTWEWIDENGSQQSAQGATITPTIHQPTTFVVTASNPNTRCTISDTISIDVVGVEEVVFNPINKTICLGDIVMLSAGEIQYTFEEKLADWMFSNSSIPSPGVNADGADWKQVASPYSLADNAMSNDSSSFMITMAHNLGPGSTVHTEMISPPISLVGLADVSLEFYHFYKRSTTQQTTAKVLVSNDGGRVWEIVASYVESRGEANKFEKIIVDLNKFIGSPNLQVKFKYAGEWGWWWAIDNVSIKQTYADASIAWSGDAQESLFIDEGATITYKGQHTDRVYFKPSKEGEFEFTLGLNIQNCNNLTNNKIVIKVENSEKPVGKTHQELHMGSRVSDLKVKGSNLRFYIKNDNKYIPQSINAKIISEETYYVSQRIGDCESGFLEILVSFLCPEPSDINVSVDIEEDETSAFAVISWGLPEVTTAISSYKLIVRNDENTIIQEKEVSNRRNYFIFKELPLEEEFVVELFSVCDRTNEVYSKNLEASFSTKLLNTISFNKVELTLFPNPMEDVLNIEGNYTLDKVEVLTKEGKRVIMQDNINNSEFQLNVETLPSGVYLIIITSTEQIRVLQAIKK